MSPISRQAIAQLLEKATVIVLTERGTGTGFFVAPNILITNRHVIESGGQIWLTSRSLGPVRSATMIKATRSSDVGSPDFALVRMDSGTAPGTLGVTSQVVKLSDVVAAGFPGVVLQNDPNFARLLKGDFTAAPDLNLTQGVVQSLQAGPGGMPLIVHTAAISGGNSGGPLVDSCGRVIGVNTFISIDNKQSTKTSYAINAKVVDAFIRAAGESIALDARQC